MIRKIVSVCYAVIFILCLFSVVAKADICIYNSKEIAEKAADLLKKNKTVIYYCPTCVDNKITKMHLKPDRVVIDGQGVVFSEDEEIDLAYIYLPTKDEKLYQNLGYILKCTDFSETKIQAFLDISKPLRSDVISELQKKLLQCDDNEVYLKVLRKDSISSSEYLSAYNDYVSGYQHCLKEVFDAAVLQFYPDKEIPLKESFDELLMSAKTYYVNFGGAYQASEYEVEWHVNRLGEYVILNLLGDVAER